MSRQKDIKAMLIVNDWRKIGEADSIYHTELGVELSLGDLHSGTTFPVLILGLPDDIVDELAEAFAKHNAYLVVGVIPTITPPRG